MAVVERGRVGRLWIVVEVHHVEGGPVDLLQGGERRSALVQVKHVEQEMASARPAATVT